MHTSIVNTKTKKTWTNTSQCSSSLTARYGKEKSFYITVVCKGATHSTLTGCLRATGGKNFPDQIKSQVWPL